ncbi:MAG: dipeptide ABC transporter ATP-binding protein [Clostridia bacterium]|nr:dipeptide ABC transporter ATP-binding protein [Clostridia bacterium]
MNKQYSNENVSDKDFEKNNVTESEESVKTEGNPAIVKATSEVTVTEKSEEFENFDDEAEYGKELAVRAEREEQDKLLPPDPDAILEVRHLKKYFTLKKTVLGKPLSVLKAVDDVSFKVYPGETLGIVGESGCGKTTMGRTVLKLHQPSGGQIFFKGTDIAGYKSKEMRPLRTQMQIVFQDPYSSLPPRSTVGDILAEPVKVHGIVPPSEVKDYVLKLMEQCGLRDYYYERYPHEFSGGQRQRICIARALAVNPELVVCDEPVSALDVSIQAQIINLLKKLQQERKFAYIFISHDLSVVKYISDKIGIMYLGSMVEFGRKEEIFSNPMHPYTVALFSAVPNPNPDEKSHRILLKGDIPSPANPPKGCKFHTRCPKAMEICKHVAPKYKEYEKDHFVACHCYSQE